MMDEQQKEGYTCYNVALIDLRVAPSSRDVIRSLVNIVAVGF